MYTYAFLEHPDSPLKLPQGIEYPTEIITSDHLCVLVEPSLSPETISGKQDTELMQAVLNHDRVLCDVFSQTDLLPLRFGTCFISLTALRDHLKEQGETYRQKLQHLKGKAEYTLKCTPIELSPETSTPVNPAPLKGREYFLAKKQLYQQQLEQEQQQNIQWQQFTQILTQLEIEIAWPEPQGNEHKLYLLVPRSQSSQLVEQSHTWQIQYPQWQFTLSSALPPYHFVA